MVNTTRDYWDKILHMPYKSCHHETCHMRDDCAEVYRHDGLLPPCARQESKESLGAKSAIALSKTEYGSHEQLCGLIEVARGLSATAGGL